MHTQSPLIIGLIIAYFLFVLFFARFLAKPVSNLKDFFLAGRQLGPIPIALACTASWIGAASTMATLNGFHSHGLKTLWELVIPSAGTGLFFTALLAKRIAAQNLLSQPESIEMHYGKMGRQILAVTILAASMAFLGSQMVAAGTLFEFVFGLDPWIAIVASTMVVMTYSAMGGFYAVVVTDMLQIVLVAIAVFILFGHVAQGTFLTPEGLQHVLAAKPPGYWAVSHNWGQDLMLTLTFVLAWSIGPEAWQRMSAVQDANLATRSAGISYIMILGFYAFLMFIALFANYPMTAGSEKTFFAQLALQMPNEILSAIVIIGFFAAVCSTMDSSMNISSLTLTHDIYGSVFRKNAGQKELVWVSRIGTILATIPAMALALYYQDIITVLWVSADIYACIMFFPIMGLLFMKKPPKLSGTLAMIFGAAVVVLNNIIQFVPGVKTEVAFLLGTIGLQWPAWPFSTLLGIIVSGFGFLIGVFWSKYKNQGMATLEDAGKPLPGMEDGQTPATSVLVA